MTMASNNRNDRFNSSSGNGSDSFQERNEHVRGFHESRLCGLGTMAQKHDKLTHSEAMRAFRLAHPENWRQWGHGVSELRAALLLLPLIREVVLVSRYWQN